LVGILGDTFIDIQAGLITLVDLKDETFDPVTVSLHDISISTLVDLPAVVP
jgi:hypothetical protein